MASHVELPLSPNSGGPFVPEKIDTLLWLNLSGGGGESSDTSTSLSTASPPPPPPIWLTLKQTKIRGQQTPQWTLNLSQILTFDRTSLYILEDRAPNIRNHYGWSIQIENNNTNNDTTTTTTTTTGIPKWSIGGSIQLNRNVAAKLVMENGTSVRTNLILKRWKQPRTTLSILNHMDMSTGRWSFLGCGIEIETLTAASDLFGPSGSNNTTTTNNDDDDADDDANYQERANLDGRKAPPTKIQVVRPK